MSKKLQSGAGKARARRRLTRGVGAGADGAPGRLKRLWMRIRTRRTTNQGVNAGPAAAPVRARAATTKKALGGRAGALKRTVGDKTPAAKKKAKEALAKRTTARKKLD